MKAKLIRETYYKVRAIYMYIIKAKGSENNTHATCFKCRRYKMSMTYSLVCDSLISCLIISWFEFIRISSSRSELLVYWSSRDLIKVLEAVSGEELSGTD